MIIATDISDLGEWGRKIIEIYMTWYTFFVTANLVIMGWCFGKESRSHDRRPLIFIAGLFSFLNLMGAVSTMRVGWSVAPIAPARFQNLIGWSACINASALVGTALVWLLLIRTLWKKTS